MLYREHRRLHDLLLLRRRHPRRHLLLRVRIRVIVVLGVAEQT
jgi:hypothetical protein